VVVALGQESRPAVRPATQPSQTSDAAWALCPVTGLPASRDCYVYYRGKRVYLSDPAARERFEAEPGDYADGVRAQWERLRPLRTQVRCPVSGGLLDQRYFVEGRDERIYFSSAEARDAWQKEPQRFTGQLQSCYVFQTLCTCGHGEIDPTVAAEFKGRTIYFCCPGCRAAFEREPARFLKQLDEQMAANEKAWRAQQVAATQPSASHP